MGSLLKEFAKQAWPGPGGHAMSNLGQQGMLLACFSAVALVSTGGASALLDGALQLGAGTIDIYSNAFSALSA
jgi:hypothetical protein